MNRERVSHAALHRACSTTPWNEEWPCTIIALGTGKNCQRRMGVRSCGIKSLRVYAYEGQSSGEGTETGIVSTWGLPTSLSNYAKFPYYIGFSMFLLVLSNLDSGQANGRIRTKNPVRLKEAGQLWVPKNEPQGHPKTILVARKQQQYQTSKQMQVTWGCFQPMSSRSFGEWCQQNIYWIRGSSLEAPGPCHMLFNALP